MSSMSEPGWEALARNPQFRELVASRRRFVFPMTAFYTLYLVAYPGAAGLREGLHGHGGARHLARALGRPQHLRADGRAARGPTRAAPVSGSAWRSASSRRRADEAARRHRRVQRRSPSASSPACSPITLVITRWAAKRTQQRDRVLRRRPRRRGRRQRRRHRRRLPVRVDVPRLRGPDVPVRLRRLDHRPRRLPVVPAGALPARRADAQRGQVHGRRRARVPPARAARCGSPPRSTRC